MPATRDSAATSNPPDSTTPTPENFRSGLILVNYGKDLLVESASSGLYRCVARRNLERMVCGDRVTWRPTGGSQGVIEAIEPRRTVLNCSNTGRQPRPLVANIDRLIVVAATEPAPDAFLIDKYLVAAELAGISPLLVVNKADLLDTSARETIASRLAEYARIGYLTLLTSALNNTGIKLLADALNGRTAILVGQSGVGKSSLVKRLLPELAIAIGRLSAASGQGRHTTTATTLYHLPGGGDLIDSPGVRDFRPGPSTQQELAGGFPEFRPRIGCCRFHNCRHLDEPGCALVAAAQDGGISRRRLESYRRMASGVAGM